MTRFVAVKLLRLVATVLVAAAILFVLLDLVPGDPARFILGINATDESVAVLHRELGLDQPAIQRFFGWLGGMMVGDFGTSVTQNAPVVSLIAACMAVTVPLSVMAIVLSVAIGLPAGIAAARRPRGVADVVLVGLARLGMGSANFWLGMLLVLLFAMTLRWLPPGGFVPWRDNALGAYGSLILPALALTLPQAAMLALLVREALVEARNSGYVRAARARGLTMREAMRKLGLRNAMLEVLGVAVPQLALLVADTVIVENVFYLPGLGRLIFDAVASHDLIVIRSALVVLILLVAGTAFLLDLGSLWIDPRLRAGRTS